MQTERDDEVDKLLENHNYTLQGILNLLERVDQRLQAIEDKIFPKPNYEND